MKKKEALRKKINALSVAFLKKRLRNFKLTPYFKTFFDKDGKLIFDEDWQRSRFSPGIEGQVSLRELPEVCPLLEEEHALNAELRTITTDPKEVKQELRERMRLMEQGASRLPVLMKNKKFLQVLDESRKALAEVEDPTIPKLAQAV